MRDNSNSVQSVINIPKLVHDDHQHSFAKAAFLFHLPHPSSGMMRLKEALALISSKVGGFNNLGLIHPGN